MRAFAASMLVATGLLLAAVPAAHAQADARLEPFTASYRVKYGGLGIGNSRLELRREDGAGRWVLKSEADASGLARLLASGTLTQTSWLEVEDGQVRPIRFRFDDGMERKNEDILLEFDREAGRVTGTAKGSPVDLEMLPNAQDPVSNQIAAMLALIDGREPEEYAMYDNPKRAKVYGYRFLREERIETEAGAFETVVYASSREGSDRETRMWLAPSLGYLAVQVESYRKGKRGFSMYLRRYVPGA